MLSLSGALHITLREIPIVRKIIKSVKDWRIKARRHLGCTLLQCPSCIDSNFTIAIVNSLVGTSNSGDKTAGAGSDGSGVEVFDALHPSDSAPVTVESLKLRLLESKQVIVGVLLHSIALVIFL